MAVENIYYIDRKYVNRILKKHEFRIKTSLKMCSHCSLCSESCFLYVTNNRNYKYVPSYKFINSLGLIYKKRKKLTREILEKASEHVWGNCVQCRRCYCPLGVDIPWLISLTRQICRSQGVFPDFGKSYKKENRAVVHI